MARNETAAPATVSTPSSSDETDISKLPRTGRLGDWLDQFLPLYLHWYILGSIQLVLLFLVIIWNPSWRPWNWNWRDTTVTTITTLRVPPRPAPRIVVASAVPSPSPTPEASAPVSPATEAPPASSSPDAHASTIAEAANAVSLSSPEAPQAPTEKVGTAEIGIKSIPGLGKPFQPMKWPDCRYTMHDGRLARLEYENQGTKDTMIYEVTEKVTDKIVRGTWSWNIKSETAPQHGTFELEERTSKVHEGKIRWQDGTVAELSVRLSH